MALLTYHILIISWGIAFSNEQVGLTSQNTYDSMKLIKEAGYYGEEHRVQTEDGYILTVHRVLPSPGLRLTQARRRPVFLQHGMWSNSYYWLTLGSNNALPYVLSDAGYDVWIGNCRGNLLSREHVFLTPDMDAFWDFSFHEMGLYDLPAVIEYMLNTTAQSEIYYIGHSMGSTMFLVMASLRPDVAAKVHFMVAMAPVATVVPVHNFLRLTILLFKRYLVKKSNRKRSWLLSRIGLSMKTLLHLIQLYLTGQFAMYDYGPEMNILQYNATTPPAYIVTNITLPVLLCYGTDDPFSTEEDVKTLISSLGDAAGLWSLPFDHREFVGGISAKKELYEKLVPLLH